MDVAGARLGMAGAWSGRFAGVRRHGASSLIDLLVLPPTLRALPAAHQCPAGRIAAEREWPPQ
jgi:hypothetical protein